VEHLTIPLLEKLTSPGPRLQWISGWLINEIWSGTLFNTLGPTEYLRKGEEVVNNFEVLISSSAPRVYDELLSQNNPDRGILTALADKDTAVVVFDGLSLREIPMMIRLAEKSRCTVKEVGCSCASIPSETISFINRELPCGRIGPSQLQGRKELKEKGIAIYYTPHPTQRVSIEDATQSIIVWSAFPDNTYTDSGAKFENHFENINVQFETAWMNTVQQIKGKSRVIITSDHGYVFFGTGMDFLRTSAETKVLNNYFGNNRFAFLSEKPSPPVSDDIVVDTANQVAMVRGRVRTRSTGESATKLYRHGGLSLMEMLVPWIVLEVE
jgi:hypothetical protein